ncbi:hypothetical protein CR513_14458, partial [Mucuna pruriens]
MTQLGRSLLGCWTIELAGGEGVSWPRQLSYAMTLDGGLEFKPNFHTLPIPSSCSRLHSHGGAQCYQGSTNNFAEPEQMENNDRNLKELATPDMVYQSWCIQYPQLEPAQTYELKSGLMHLRRSPQALKRIPYGLFHNKATRDVGGLHQNEGVSIFLGWSSKGLAIFGAGSFQHLERHKHMFLEKFFPASRATTIRKQIYEIRGVGQPRMVNEIGVVNNQRLENQLTKLTMLIRHLVVGQHQPSIASRVCGICTSMEHPTNMCPTLQEIESDHP